MNHTIMDFKSFVSSVPTVNLLTGKPCLEAPFVGDHRWGITGRRAVVIYIRNVTIMARDSHGLSFFSPLFVSIYYLTTPFHPVSPMTFRLLVSLLTALLLYIRDSFQDHHSYG